MELSVRAGDGGLGRFPTRLARFGAPVSAGETRSAAAGVLGGLWVMRRQSMGAGKFFSLPNAVSQARTLGEKLLQQCDNFAKNWNALEHG